MCTPRIRSCGVVTGGLRRISEDYGRAARKRGNGIYTAACVKCGGNHQGSRHNRWQRGTGAMHAAQYLAKREIKCAKTGLAGGGFVVVSIMRIALLCLVSVRGMFEGVVRVPGGVHQRALLRHQQQENQKIMNVPAGHDGWDKQQRFSNRPARGAEFAATLFSDGHHRIGKAIIKPHRIVFQHREFTGQQYRLEAVFHRRLGLHFNHLLRPAGQTERA